MKPNLHKFKAIVQPLTAKTRLEIPIYFKQFKIVDKDVSLNFQLSNCYPN